MSLVLAIIIAVVIIYFLGRTPKDEKRKHIGGTCPECGKSGGLYEHWHDYPEGWIHDYTGCKYCDQMHIDFYTEEVKIQKSKDAVCPQCHEFNDKWQKKTSILKEETKNGNPYIFVEDAEYCGHCSYKRNITTRWMPK